MGLSGQHRKKLRDALIDAFPDKASLEQMLSFGLDEKLDIIASGGNLREIVFNLIKQVEAENRVENLIYAACQSNPGNSRLKAIAEAAKLDKTSEIAICDADKVIDFNSRYENDRTRQSDNNNSAFSITGSFEKNKINVAKLKAIEASLQEIAGDASLKIIDIEEGSIRLILEGSQEGLERLEQLFKSGELTEVLDIPVEDVSFVDAGTSKNDKKRLAFTITENATVTDIENLKAGFTKISNQENTKDDDKSCSVGYVNLSGTNLRYTDIRGVNLSCADLSGADLSGADLSGANLSGANLSGANLSGANVENTRFGNSEGIFKEMRDDLIRRGAIFEDTPGDGDRSLH